MGQQQSAEKGSTGRSATPQAEKERKHKDRVSISTLSNTRGTPVDPSASIDSAVAYTTPQHLEKPVLQQYIQSQTSETTAKPNKEERSSSRPSSGRKNELEHRSKQDAVSAPPSGPVNVPASKSKQDDFDDKHFGEKQHPYQDRRYTPVAQLRPPRLPLPIADVPVPESPTLLPVDKGNADVPIFETDDPLTATEPELRRRSSVLSTTTQDEEDMAEELQPYAVDPSSHTVPTMIEWNQPGNKVYVTGTFANWERKFRLHHRKSSSGMFTTINLPPGTHHLKFIVDDHMMTSAHLPTAVDFNNVLVNYIEIAIEDISKTRRESSQAGAKAGGYPAQSPLFQETQDRQDDLGDASPDESDLEEPRAEEIPAGDFRQIVPQALLDIDLPEDDPRYQQAARVLGDGVGPPSLPLFLSRSILNGILPVKDDSSVLNLPNHTVLNHLMTSSVKNGVLSTSVTTRYKKKYVTTISFKPVPKFQQP